LTFSIHEIQQKIYSVSLLGSQYIQFENQPEHVRILKENNKNKKAKNHSQNIVF